MKLVNVLKYNIAIQKATWDTIDMQMLCQGANLTYDQFNAIQICIQIKDLQDPQILTVFFVAGHQSLYPRGYACGGCWDLGWMQEGKGLVGLVKPSKLTTMRQTF